MRMSIATIDNFIIWIVGVSNFCCFVHMCAFFFSTLKYQRQMPIDFFPLPKTLGTANIFLWHNCLQMYHIVFHSGSWQAQNRV